MAAQKELYHRPAVHQLCTGGFIQESIPIGEHVTAVPLRALGFDTQATYVARYAAEIPGTVVDEDVVPKLKKQVADACPVVAMVVRHKIDGTAEDLERVAAPILDRARAVLSLAMGDLPEPFAFVVATEKQTFFRVTPPSNRQRYRLGMGNIGADYRGQLARIMRCAEEDERFAFALSLFRDALREQNPEFRVARFFSCLEALAYRIKDDKGSRQRVRKLLGLESGAVAKGVDGASSYVYDRVELAGRIRDKLFHGIPFRPRDDLNEGAARAYDYLSKHPKQLRDILLCDCELEFARWANGASRGQEPNIST